MGESLSNGSLQASALFAVKPYGNLGWKGHFVSLPRHMLYQRRRAKFLNKSSSGPLLMCNIDSKAVFKANLTAGKQFCSFIIHFTSALESFIVSPVAPRESGTIVALYVGC